MLARLDYIVVGTACMTSRLTRAQKPGLGAILTLAGLILALCPTSVRAQPANAEPGAGADRKPPSPATDRQIQSAIRSGIDYLKTRAATIETGPGGLAAMALLKAGVPADAPVIQAVIKKIEARMLTGGKYVPANSHTHIYEAGVCLMALANADAKRYKPQIQAIADYIISRQGDAGDWDYPERTTGDTSISQYAILGLWEAVRSGIDVPTVVWDRAAAWHISRQLRNGSFTYHPSGTEEDGTHTMTVAGIGSLYVARMHLYPTAEDLEERELASATPRRRGTKKRFGLLEPADPDDEKSDKPAPAPDLDRPTVRLAAIDRSIARATAWLSAGFVIDPNTVWKQYYLYGIERTMALANASTFDGHDWYVEGAAQLVGTQLKDGSWTEPGGNEPATSFAVLFLSKATSKMLKRNFRPVPKFGAGLLAGGRGLPDNLSEVQLEKGKVEVRKLAGPVDDLLAELENAQSRNVESAQAALVDTAAIEKPEALVGRKDRLAKLVLDPRPEVRRTALWALGRTNDIRTAPLLIEALLDPNLDCMVEARNALQYISRKSKDLDLPDQPTEAQRAAAVARWRKWYRSIRPYDERDDLPEATGS